MTFKEWRTKEGLTQEEAGDLIGVTKAHVCRMENGERTPSLRRAARIEEVTRGAVTVAELAKAARTARGGE